MENNSSAINTKAEQNAKNETKYTKEQLVESKDFVYDKDILMAVLDEKKYSKKEAKKAIEDFKKGKVR